MDNYLKLEKEYAKFIGHTYGVSVNNGTNALHLALKVAGVEPGMEVIVPDFTMASCGFAVNYCGAKVVTVDCNERLLIDVSLIEQAITPRTKVIMPVHIYGRVCEMDKIMKIAKKHNLIVIEDACESQGADIGKADMTVCSFYQNKIIHAEEGGMITTNNKKFANRMRYLKNMCFDSEHTYYHNEIGFNMRMPDSQAIMALNSLKMLKANLKKRRQIESWLDEFIPIDYRMPKRDTVWVYDIMYPDKEKVIKNKMFRHFFKPLSTMPMWKQKVGENALKASKTGMYIICDIHYTKEDYKKLCKLL